MMKVFKKKLSVTVAGLLALTILVLGNIAIVSASDTGGGKVYIAKNGQFYAAKSDIKRSTAYDSVYVTVESVYPSSGEDTFTKCRCKLTSGTIDISNEQVLEEDANKKHSINILNGYLNKKKFTLNFAGNNPKYGAYIVYKYDGR